MSRTPDEENILQVLHGWAAALTAARMAPSRRWQAAVELTAVRDALASLWPKTVVVDPPQERWFDPLPGFRISGYPFTPGHEAWDCNAQAGQPQIGAWWGALKPGTVRFAGRDRRPGLAQHPEWDRGLYVLVDYRNGEVGGSCHFSEVLVETGDEVAGGQALGLIGATGAAQGPHVHQWVEREGVRFDWLAESGLTPTA